MIQQQMLPQGPGVVVMPSSGPMPTIQPGQPGAYGARPVAWEYPLKGLGHFCTHPGLWVYALCPVVCSLFALIFAFGLVASTFAAQHDFVSVLRLACAKLSAAAASTQGPARCCVPMQIVARGWYSDGTAWLVVFLLCLAELAIATLAFLQIALMCIMHNVFVQTMKHKGVWQGENDKFNIADELFWVVVNVGTAFVTLWLHLIPVIGTLLYCAGNGAVRPLFPHRPHALSHCPSAPRAPRPRAYNAVHVYGWMLRTFGSPSQLMAWEYHEIYFNMIGIGKRAQRHEVCAHKGDYLMFGMVAQLMLFVPFIGPVTFVSRATLHAVCS